jgi:hypothetical protein
MHTTRRELGLAGLCLHVKSGTAAEIKISATEFAAQALPVLPIEQPHDFRLAIEKWTVPLRGRVPRLHYTRGLDHCAPGPGRLGTGLQIPNVLMEKTLLIHAVLDHGNTVYRRQHELQQLADVADYRIPT